MQHRILQLAVAAAMMGRAEAADPGHASTITVVGAGEVETQPDVAIIHFSVRGEGPSSDAATRSMAAKQEAILNGLATLGDGRMQIHTGDVSLNQARAGNCGSDDDGDQPRLSTGTCAVVGYIATIGVTVRMASTMEAGTAVGLAGRLGAREAELNGFALSEPVNANRRAAAAAIADARDQAETIAAASREKLGPLLTVSDENAQLGNSQEIIVTGRRAPAPMVSPPPVRVDLRPEPVRTTKRLVVTFAIER